MFSFRTCMHPTTHHVTHIIWNYFFTQNLCTRIKKDYSWMKCFMQSLVTYCLWFLWVFDKKKLLFYNLNDVHKKNAFSIYRIHMVSDQIKDRSYVCFGQKELFMHPNLTSALYLDQREQYLFLLVFLIDRWRHSFLS